MKLLDRPISFTFTLRPVLRGSLWFYGGVLTFGLLTHLLPGPRDHGPIWHALGLVSVAMLLLSLSEPPVSQESNDG